MITYDYDCADCDGHFSVERSIRDVTNEATCPSCGSLNVKRHITGGCGFVLKGEGWAKDGYASSRVSK
jgi:putative FmdB family regulatory protein